MKCQRTLTSILAHIAIALQQFISALLKVSMDGDFHCALCPFSGNSIAEFSSHVIRFHKNDPGFLVKCSFCSATYQKYDSYRRHLNRKHSVCTVNLMFTNFPAFEKFDFVSIVLFILSSICSKLNCCPLCNFTYFIHRVGQKCTHPPTCLMMALNNCARCETT